MDGKYKPFIPSFIYSFIRIIHYVKDAGDTEMESTVSCLQRSHAPSHFHYYVYVKPIFSPYTRFL